MAVNWIKKSAALGMVAVGSLAIAAPASARFVVFVAGNDATTLQRVRAVSPNAFASRFNDQPIVQAGIFNSEISADSLAISLQQSGLTAQKYFRTTTSSPSNGQVSFSDAPTNFVPTGLIQPLSYAQVAQAPTGFIQPQTNFIQPSSTIFAPTYSETFTPTTLQAPVSNGVLIPQATQNVNFRYIAAVPAVASNQFLLARVRQYIPSAFIANSGRGTYIHAGAYQNRDEAESVSRYLRSQGLDSRVLYF
jgi:hypothetical protein